MTYPTPHQVFKGANYFHIDLPYIAKVLTRLPRFCGHGYKVFTVGQHSNHCLLLSKIWQPDNERLHQLCLYHDISESYYGDIPTYIKTQLGEEARMMFNKIDKEIFEHLGITYSTASEKAEVKVIDHLALTLEAYYVFGADYVPEDWPMIPEWFYTNATSSEVKASLTLSHFPNSEEFLLRNLREYQTL